jgi:WD40 repeat protein
MIDFERLDRAVTGTARVVGLVGPPGSGRTTLASAYCARPEITRRFRGIGRISLGTPPDTPGWLPWPDSPAAAELTLQIARTLKQWGSHEPRRYHQMREPVAADQAAAELAAWGDGRLLVVDEVVSAEQVAMFEGYQRRGRLLLITEHVSLLPRGAVVVWAPSPPGEPGSRPEPGPLPEPNPLVTDPRWMSERLAEDGAPGLAADLALAWAARADPAVVAVARTLRDEEDAFAAVREPRTLAALVSALLPVAPAEEYRPGPPYLVNRWPPPGRFGAALIRRIPVEEAENELTDILVTRNSLWTVTSDPFHGGAEISRWEPLSGRRLIRLTLKEAGAVRIAVAPDDSWLAYSTPSDAGFNVADPVTRRIHGFIPGRVAAAAPDGTWLAVADEQGVVRIHDTGTLSLNHQISVHWAQVTALAVAPDGSWLASAGKDGTVRIIEVATGRPGRAVTVGEVTHLAAVPGGKWLAAAGPYGVHLIQPSTGRNRRIHAGVGVPHALAVAGDGSWLAAAYDGAGLLVFDTTTGDLRHAPPVPAGFFPRWSRVRLAAAPDGSWLAAGNPMRIYDPVTGEHRGGFPAETWSSRAVAPDGSWMAAHAGHDVVILDLHARPVPGAEPGHADLFQELFVAPDGSWLATRSAQEAPRFWDATNGRRLPVQAADVTFEATPTAETGDAVRSAHDGHTIISADVSPDGRWLAVLDLPDAYHRRLRHSWLRVYDRAASLEVAAVPVLEIALGCRWSPDGTALFVWGGDGVQGFTWVTQSRV